MRISEIYVILNIQTGKRYVGQTTVSAVQRLKIHFRKARTTNTNTPFYNAIRKYGECSFVIERTIRTDTSQLDVIEIATIQELDTRNPSKGYNILSGGCRPNDEDLQRMSECSKRLWSDPAYRKSVTDAVIASKNTPEAKSKMSVSQKAAWQKSRKKPKPHKKPDGWKEQLRQRMLSQSNELSIRAKKHMKQLWSDPVQSNMRIEKIRKIGKERLLNTFGNAKIKISFPDSTDVEIPAVDITDFCRDNKLPYAGVLKVLQVKCRHCKQYKFTVLKDIESK